MGFGVWAAPSFCAAAAGPLALYRGVRSVQAEAKAAMNRCSVNNSLLSTSPTCEPWTTSSHAVALAVGSMNESGETTLHLQGVRTGDSGKRGPIFQNDTELQTGIVGKRVRLSALYDISTRVRYALGYARAPGRRLWPLQNAQKSQWSHTCDEITANDCKSHGLRCIWRDATSSKNSQPSDTAGTQTQEPGHTDDGPRTRAHQASNGTGTGSHTALTTQNTSSQVLFT